jgi:hypothetical protein
VSGASDCPDIFAGYAKLCDQPEVPPKEVATTSTAKSKVDAGSVHEVKAVPAKDAAASAAQLAANKQADAGGCAVMKEVSARYPPPAAGPSGSTK